MNKKIFVVIIFFMCVLYLLYSQEYHISVEHNGNISEPCILAYYYGRNQIVADSSERVNHNTIVFRGNESLDEGIYFIKQSKGRYFELLIGEDQDFTVIADTSYTIEKMTIKGAQETEAFLSYQQFMISVNEQKLRLAEQYRPYMNRKDSTTHYKEKSKALETKIRNKWDEIINDYPGTLFANIIKLFITPEMPAIQASLPELLADSDSLKWTKSLQFYQHHYLDHVVFTDERLLLTPFFADKIFTYLTKVISQDPDSVTKAIKRIMDLSIDNKHMYKYLLDNMLHYYETSGRPGADEIFVYLAEEYYLSGKVDWVNLLYQKALDEKVQRRKK